MDSLMGVSRKKRLGDLLVDAGGVPVEEVRQFLRFEDNRGMARNTLKQKCIHLKHFYTFLQQKRMKYRTVTVDDIYCMA